MLVILPKWWDLWRIPCPTLPPSQKLYNPLLWYPSSWPVTLLRPNQQTNPKESPPWSLMRLIEMWDLGPSSRAAPVVAGVEGVPRAEAVPVEELTTLVVLNTLLLEQPLQRKQLRWGKHHPFLQAWRSQPHPLEPGQMSLGSRPKVTT